MIVMETPAIFRNETVSTTSAWSKLERIARTLVVARRSAMMFQVGD